MTTYTTNLTAGTYTITGYDVTMPFHAIPTPDARKLVTRRRQKTETVLQEDRTLSVPSRDKTLTIEE